MTDDKSQVTSHGVGVGGLLGTAFVVLKLIGVIDWSWWWVTAPFWGGLAIVLAIIFGGLAVITLWYFLGWLFSITKDFVKGKGK